MEHRSFPRLLPVRSNPIRLLNNPLNHQKHLPIRINLDHLNNNGQEINWFLPNRLGSLQCRNRAALILLYFYRNEKIEWPLVLPLELNK